MTIRVLLHFTLLVAVTLHLRLELRSIECIEWVPLPSGVIPELESNTVDRPTLVLCSDRAWPGIGSSIFGQNEQLTNHFLDRRFHAFEYVFDDWTSTELKRICAGAPVHKEVFLVFFPGNGDPPFSEKPAESDKVIAYLDENITIRLIDSFNYTNLIAAILVALSLSDLVWMWVDRKHGKKAVAKNGADRHVQKQAT